VSLRLPRTAPGLALAPALVLGLALALTGCGANFEAQTYATRTVADGTNVAVGAIAIRNVTIAPPESGDMHDAGEDVEVFLTLTNDGPDDDQLVEVTSSAARSVEVLEEGSETDELELPRLGTTGNRASLRLVGLTEDLRPGRYVELTLRFASNGEVTVQVPVATTGEYDEDREHSENFHEIGEEH
jgi:copper(I)-binding protein